jgi:hypothetical protein
MKTIASEEATKAADAANRTGELVRESGLYHCRQCELVNLRLGESTEFPRCGRCMSATQWVLCR